MRLWKEIIAVVEEVLSGVFRVEIPLPRNPLKALNSYVFQAAGRSLIVDTGMNREECRTAMAEALAELALDLRETDFFITHLHADHSGLVGALATATSRVYGSESDANRLNYPAHWDGMRDYAARSGFPEDELREAVDKHPGRRYRTGQVVDFTHVREGDRVEVGDYRFVCVATPGHTQGHMCLYDGEKRLLVAGDHLLDDITPNISLFADDQNPLRQYLDSLDKIDRLEIDLALPGHRRLIRNHRGRIEELRRHHRERADEVLAIVGRGTQNAYQVASRMTWDLTYSSWDQFPVQQKWFATGEAIAHLKFLEEEGAIRREMAGRDVYYTASQ